MGCLNDEGKFEHWFGNIHLSGPCNRSCYFCIGQHMMALDPFNNLKKWPLAGIDEFVRNCKDRGVREVFVTGTNTDPLLYSRTDDLVNFLKGCDFVVGVRTNGALVLENVDRWRRYDKASVTICSFDPQVHLRMMGSGEPPDIDAILRESGHMADVKVNVVLGPENSEDDVFVTLERCARAGVKRVNLREPYGQPHVGDVLELNGFRPDHLTMGMPTYTFPLVDCPSVKTSVTYWDVHYCEVESVNLYANGTVSETYPITRGHHPSGEVRDQESFPGGRVREQWLYNVRRGAR